MVLPGSTFPTFYIYFSVLKCKGKNSQGVEIKFKIAGWTCYYYQVVKSFHKVL